MITRANTLKSLTAATVLAAAGAASADVIAFDLVGSASQNLVGYTNPWTDAFTSAGDGFQIYQRGVSGSIPFAVLDDSAVTFPPDGIGIIDDFNTDAFFGMVDTQNNDNNGPVSATWDFDVAGFTDLSIGVDIGAMGDFESSDSVSFAYSIDGGPLTTLFELIADEAGSHTYTLAGGGVFTLSDPMTVGGTVLTNELQTIAGALVGSGSILSLTVTAMLNGGDEGIAFQNLVVQGTAPVPAPGVLLLLGAGLLSMGLARRSA